MPARLVAVAGPMRGTSIQLEESGFTVGRDPQSSLWLDDPAVSRQHCLFRLSETGWEIVDRKSRNGTLVNSERITVSPLLGGEEIRLGQSVFVFKPEDVSEDVQPPDLSTSTRTLIARLNDSVFLRPGAMVRQTELEDQLTGLLRFSTELAAATDAFALEERITALLPELLPAPAPRVLWLDDHTPADQPETQATTQGVVVIAGDSVMVVPLRYRGVTAALIRLESNGAFHDSHLQIGAAIGAIASLALSNIRQIEALAGENQRLQSEIEGGFDMVGESPRMRDVYATIARVAPTDATVLILGESGTGKELIARAIHRNSPRAAKPFVAVNCAALTESLLESELFGHEKGAFTGATAQKRGRIEMAEGGTLFLDEIGELARNLQAKLLRVLQQREFERVGGLRTLYADVRVIAATNRDLLAATRSGGFREDLYYRLNVISVRAPALRERREDILSLASYFASRFGARAGRPDVDLAPATRACLLRYAWPGNVRELENAIERAVVLGAGPWLLPEDLPEEIALTAAGEPEGADYHEQVLDAKRKILLAAIEQAGGSHTAAAKLLGLNPTYLSRLLRTVGIRE